MAERGRRPDAGPSGRSRRGDAARGPAGPTDRRRAGRAADHGRSGRKRGTGESAAAGEGREPEQPSRVLRRHGARPKTGERTIFGLTTGRAAILAVVVSALALTLAVPLRTYFTQRAEAGQVAAERVQLEKDVAALQSKTAQQNDPAYTRAQARDRLRLVMPGETPFIVQLPGSGAPEPDQQARQQKPTGSWYTGLWQSISGHKGDPHQEP